MAADDGVAASALAHGYARFIADRASQGRRDVGHALVVEGRLGGSHRSRAVLVLIGVVPRCSRGRRGGECGYEGAVHAGRLASVS
ncbi:hypothetical protein OHB06_42070 [Streptomyces sp. NBC_01604]|uniref:hypothetical protein n=1 Tax=Streptomyces sp. NBC_01604 TaxID=2975894 RepID=UPI00386A7C93